MDAVTWLDPEPRFLGSTEDQILDSLHPSIRVLARELLRRRPELRIVSGYRSMEEQERLYAQGRTAPGEIVTNAKPGRSWHNYALAFDVTPPSDAAGREGERLELKWGGTFRTFDDPNHFEYHPGLTLEDAAAGKRPAMPTLGKRGWAAPLAFAAGGVLAFGIGKALGWL